MFWLYVIGAVLVLLAILLKPVKGVTNPRVPPDLNPPEVDWESIIQRDTPATGVQYLVVGAGFLGKKIIHTLLLRGETKIKAFDIDPRVEEFYSSEPRVTVIRGDVTKLEDLQEACQGVHTVYCTFAVITYMQRLPQHAAFSERINVGGTRNVCEAALKSGVTNLICTSSSNVSMARELVHSDMTEESPYVTRDNSPNHYGWTKALAEQTALEYDGRGPVPLNVTVIRPCSGIFGFGDRFLTQKPMDDGFVLGIRPRIKLDFVFVDNVAYAHLLAEARLRDSRDSVHGQVFCVTNQQPMHSDDFNNSLRSFFPKIKLYYGPAVLLTIVAHTVETLQWMFPRLRLGELENLTPAMLETCLSYEFKDHKASKVLKYKPVYTVDQGLVKTVKEYNQNSILPTLK